jgi:hypothetical protein
MTAANGSSATLRACLIAVVNRRWWRAQLPVMRLGMIFPRSVMKFPSVRVSL